MSDTLFPIILLEAVLGGGGRTFSYGPLSLRMALFGLGLVVWIATILFSARQRDGVGLAGVLIAAFFASLVPALLVDADRGTPIAAIAQELQPLLFWLNAPLFAMALKDEASVKLATRIILYGGLVVAAATTLITVGTQFGYLSFGLIYGWASRTNELFFRSGGSFFYKGHFYAGIAFVFCIILTPRWWKTMLAILALSIALSLTRGLYLAVVVASALSFLSRRRSFAVIASVVIGVTAVVLYGDALLALVYDPTRLISSETRTRDFAYFVAIFDYKTLLLGEGLGVLLNGRQSIENSYVWALWRFGIVGLLFWLLPLFLAIRYYLRIAFVSGYHRTASAFFFGMVMLYVVTLSNPFINNSIGMSFALCAVFALRRLSLLEAAGKPAAAARA